MAQDFKEQFNINFVLYTDPKRETYKAFGFPKGVGIGFKTVASGFSLFSKGHRQGITAGDPLQQGGEILFDSNGVILLKNIADMAGEHMPIDNLLTEIKKVMTETG